MEYAPALLAAGFEPVPIAPGYKYPKGIANWQEMEITADVVDRWAANGKSGYGVGIRCRTCPAVDIDCQDELIVEQSIRLVNSIIGLDNPLCRVGNPPICKGDREPVFLWISFTTSRMAISLPVPRLMISPEVLSETAAATMPSTRSMTKLNSRVCRPSVVTTGSPLKHLTINSGITALVL